MAKKFELKTKLTVDDKLTPGLLKAQRKAQRAMASIGKAARKANKRIAIGAAAAATAGVAGLTKLTLDYAAYADSLGKTRDLTGMSVKALQELDFVAGRYAVTQSTMTAGVVRFNKRIGLAAAGAGAMYAPMKKMSPALLDAIMNADNASDAFDLMVAAMAKIPNEQQRIALATMAFGDDAAAFARFASDGIRAFRAQRREAGRYNQITDEQTKAAAKFQDRLGDVKIALGGVSNAIGSELVPVLTPYLEQLAEWIAKNDEVIGQEVGKHVAKFAEAMAKTDWESVADSINTVSDAVLWLGENLSVNLVASFAAAQAALSGHPLFATIIAMGAAVHNLNTFLDTTQKSSRDIAQSGSFGERAYDAFSSGPRSDRLALRIGNGDAGHPAAFGTIEEARSAVVAHEARFRRQRRITSEGFQGVGGGESKVVVEFQNAPDGMRVKSVTGKVPTNVKTGRRFGGSP